MGFERIKNKGQARLFQNNSLEVMTKTHPVVIYSIYLPLITFMLYYSIAHKGMPAPTAIGLFIAGLFSWTLFEYLIHRYLFHMVAEGETGKKIAYLIHGVHHEYPRDRDRLFMPPVPSLIVASVLFSIIYFLMGARVFSFFPGFLLGYLIYGSMHYAIHAYAPPKMMKALWRNHHLHHYKTPNKGFGVSSVLWDVVFGTMPGKDEV